MNFADDTQASHSDPECTRLDIKKMQLLNKVKATIARCDKLQARYNRLKAEGKIATAMPFMETGN